MESLKAYEKISESSVGKQSVTGSSMQGVFLDWVAKETHFKEIVFVLRPESV